jgi:hypothetical protein
MSIRAPEAGRHDDINSSFGRAEFPFWEWGLSGFFEGVPPSPCFCHEYQNKGVTGVNYAKNIKTKGL